MIGVALMTAWISELAMGPLPVGRAFDGVSPFLLPPLLLDGSLVRLGCLWSRARLGFLSLDLVRPHMLPHEHCQISLPFVVPHCLQRHESRGMGKSTHTNGNRLPSAAIGMCSGKGKSTICDVVLRQELTEEGEAQTPVSWAESGRLPEISPL